MEFDPALPRSVLCVVTDQNDQMAPDVGFKEEVVVFDRLPRRGARVRPR